MSPRTVCLAFVFFCLAAYCSKDPLMSRAAWDRKATAYVFMGDDLNYGSQIAANVLQRAGFKVKSLPHDKSPVALDADVILFGSYIADQPAYQKYMRDYATDLKAYVHQGHLLVQMAQDSQYESMPAFLPQTLEAHRMGETCDVLYALNSRHRLVPPMDVELTGRAMQDPSCVGEAFIQQCGFEVLLAGDACGRQAVLLQGTYGLGRILLSALPLELENDTELSTHFFRSLFQYALDIRGESVESLKATPPVETIQECVAGSWSLVLLPDVQIYTDRHPGIFVAQTGWIAQNHEARTIRYVLQLGDLTNRNSLREWENARMALELLHGKVPYAFCLGNHDYGPKGNATTRDTYADIMLPVTAYSHWPTFGGVMQADKMDNTFHLFSAGGRQWLILCLGWCPQDEAVQWANSIMQTYPDRHGILVTHAFVDIGGRLLDIDKIWSQPYHPYKCQTPGTKNDGKDLWNKLVSKHNFKFVFSGHVLGSGNG